MEVWTLSFATGNTDNQFCCFAQEAIVALEEVKRCSSAETALWENTQKMEFDGGVNLVFCYW